MVLEQCRSEFLTDVLRLVCISISAKIIVENRNSDSAKTAAILVDALIGLHV
jgi:hypothetical protein